MNGYDLPGRILPGRGVIGPLFAIHGARSDHMRLDPLLRWLQGQGVGSLGFSLSGHGAASPIPLAQTSLTANLREAQRFYEHWPAAQACVLGQSLGGALALQLAMAAGDRVRKLVLLCPAIYPNAAWQASRFGLPFTQAISVPFDAAQSDCVAFLRRFAGQMLLVRGEFDGLRADQYGQPAGRSAGMVWAGGRRRYSAIPAEVFDAIAQALPPGRLESVVLPDCDHGISDWLAQDDARVAALGQRVLAFLARP
jgi:pimeloyl-ACP methyl ester carboxylesterase